MGLRSHGVTKRSGAVPGGLGRSLGQGCHDLAGLDGHLEEVALS